MTSPLSSLEPEYEALRETTRRFAIEEVAPRAAQIDRTESYSEDLFKSMLSAGLLGLTIPADLGGSGAGMFGLCIAVEEVSRYCQSAGLMLLLSRLATGPILISGTEEQKDRYVRGIAEGSLRGSFCLTEPEAGSDTAAVRTTARRDGDAYVLNGRKCYISGATVADFYIVWARDQDQGDGHNHVGFIVERQQSGVSVGKIDEKMGVRGVPTAEVIFDDVIVPTEQRLTQPGTGFADLMAALNSARPGVAARALGLTAGALQYAWDYGVNRRTFGQRVVDHQGIQFIFADIAMNLEAARGLVYSAARMVDAGSYRKKAAPYLAMAKCFSSDLAVRAASDCLQVLGGAGYMCEHPMERFYRDAKQLQIVEGTSQIQRLIIARAIDDGTVRL
jgi:alkylation response protein AidB-like acyl-CoA dehydrogenase